MLYKTKSIKYLTINPVNHANKNPQKSNSLDSCNSWFLYITHKLAQINFCGFFWGEGGGGRKSPRKLRNFRGVLWIKLQSAV